VTGVWYPVKKVHGGYGVESARAASTEDEARLARIRNAMATYHGGDPELSSISAMPVLIDYWADWSEFQLSKRGEEHIFQFTLENEVAEDGSLEPGWRSSSLNAYALLDDFQKAKTPIDALDFLNKTGQFSVLDFKFTLSYFKRWQRFAYLVQEHDLLASAQKKGLSSGECSEALKALSGDKQSRFFEGTEIPSTPEGAVHAARWMEDPKNAEGARKELDIDAEYRAKLCAWFRQPPADAFSIEWIPKSLEDCQSVDPLVANGAMMEFLLPQKAMRPVLFIRPTNTLEAIAAAIYSDRVRGVEYRACEVCSELFDVGTRGEKKYCSRERCKNTAHQRRMRANRSGKKKALREGIEA
jgi:hypothetical protein